MLTTLKSLFKHTKQPELIRPPAKQDNVILFCPGITRPNSTDRHSNNIPDPPLARMTIPISRTIPFVEGAKTQNWQTPRASSVPWSNELQATQRINTRSPRIPITPASISAGFPDELDSQPLATNQDVEIVLRSTVYVARNDPAHEFMGRGIDKARVTTRNGAIHIEKPRMIFGQFKDGSFYVANKAMTVGPNGALQVADPNHNPQPALVYKINPVGIVETNRMAEANSILPANQQLDFASAARKCRETIPTIQAQFRQKSKVQNVALG